jgi:hypothetical protein
MSVPAGRTALFPVGPTAPLTFAAGSPERASVAAALITKADENTGPMNPTDCAITSGSSRIFAPRRS